MSKNTDFDADVVITGLGPTGLVLSHMLGMRGHKVIILEREPVFYGNARAVYTDDECMRIFQHIRCAEELQKDMLLDTPVQFTRPDGTVMGQYKPLFHPFGWPVVNFFYQPYLETTLTELLSRYPNVEIRRGRELTRFNQDADGVSLTHQATRSYRFSDNNDSREENDSDADEQTLSARYMVGADGGRSVTREALGIKMTGKNFPEPWLVVDLKQKKKGVGLRHMPYFNFVVDPKMPVVSCVQPDGFHRFEFMMMEGQTKEWLEQDDTVRMLLSKYVNPDDFEVKRKLVYTFNALMAERWREGRVLLAGDAAHMTPQFMGQGASSGVRDAHNLGWKLSMVLRGQAGDSLLDTYQSERHSHAQAMIDVSVMLKDVVSMTNPVATAVRDVVLKVSQGIKPARDFFEEGKFKPTPVYKKGAYLGLPRSRRSGPEGAMAPQPEVRRFDGRRVLLDDLLGSEFSLVGLNIDPFSVLSDENLRRADALNLQCVTLYGYGERPQATQGVVRDLSETSPEVEQIDGEMVQWFARAGYKKQAVAILRPDKFAYAVVAPSALNKALATLAEQLTPSAAQAA